MAAFDKYHATTSDPDPTITDDGRTYLTINPEEDDDALCTSHAVR